MFFTFLEKLSHELHGRFKEKNYTPTGSILSGLCCLTVSRHWKGKLDDKAAASINNMCQFYDVEEKNIITELKVFHSSYALLSNNVTAALKCLGENDVESVFPSVTMLLKMFDYTSNNGFTGTVVLKTESPPC